MDLTIIHRRHLWMERNPALFVRMLKFPSQLNTLQYPQGSLPRLMSFVILYCSSRQVSRYASQLRHYAVSAINHILARDMVWETRLVLWAHLGLGSWQRMTTRWKSEYVNGLIGRITFPSEQTDVPSGFEHAQKYIYISGGSKYRYTSLKDGGTCWEMRR
jgi:hypothetical protein